METNPRRNSRAETHPYDGQGRRWRCRRPPNAFSRFGTDGFQPGSTPLRLTRGLLGLRSHVDYARASREVSHQKLVDHRAIIHGGARWNFAVSIASRFSTARQFLRGNARADSAYAGPLRLDGTIGTG